MKLKIFMIVVMSIIAHTAQAYMQNIGGWYISTMSEQYGTMALECGNTEDNGFDAPTHVENAASDEFTPGMNPCRYWVGNSYAGDVVIPAEMELFYKQQYIMREIHIGAFCNCPDLESVTIPETVSYIGLGALTNCNGLSKVEIPGSVTDVGAFAFDKCYYLEEVVFSPNCDKIDSYTFWQTGYRLNTFKISGVDNVNRIGPRAFYMSSLREYPNWENLSEIAEGAFSATPIEYVHIPVGCVLGTYAFRDCPNLKTVELPSDCQANIDAIFELCPAIELIRIEAVAPPELSADWASAVAEGCVLEVPVESIDMYRAAPFWKEFSTIRALTAGVDEVKAREITVKGKSGCISVSGSSQISVYDMSGVCIYQGACGDIAATPGVYVIKSPMESVRVRVN